jgi:nitrilase
MGDVLAGPLYGEEGLLTAEANMEELVRSKMDFDVIGHYSRDDVFRFDVPGQPEIKKD